MNEPFSPGFFRRLQQLKIHTRRSFLGSRQGLHRSLRKGHGLEFSDYRPYVPGDDFRHIDWGIYGRTDRLFVREYREEQDLNVLLLLDCSRSMFFPEGENKFELARELALALGYIALTDGDSVTFSFLGHNNTPRFKGPRCLNHAAELTRQVSAAPSFEFTTEVRAAADRQKIPGKCFLISDFLFSVEEQISALNFLRSRNFEIVVLRILAPSELKLDLKAINQVVDVETGKTVDLALDKMSQKEYALSLAAHLEQLELYCNKAGIPNFLLSSEEKLTDIILTKLPQARVLR